MKEIEKKAILVHRITQEVYDDLVKKFPPPIVNNDTTAHMAGYQLGIQHVLAELRKGVVIRGD
jgi:hypothetical protein